MSQQRPCRACMRALLVAPLLDQGGQPQLDDKGKAKVIPLDLSAPVYTVLRDAAGNVLGCVRASASHVSHFCTCTDPKRFSKGHRG